MHLHYILVYIYVCIYIYVHLFVQTININQKNTRFESKNIEMSVPKIGHFKAQFPVSKIYKRYMCT